MPKPFCYSRQEESARLTVSTLSVTCSPPALLSTTPPYPLLFMTTPAPFSPSNTLIKSALEQATTKADVRELFQRHDVSDINAAWKELTPLERASLNLCRVFDGTIIHDYTEEPGANSPLGPRPDGAGPDPFAA